MANPSQFILEMPVPADVESPKVDSELKSKLESFDKSKLKSTKTEVKNTLPSKEGNFIGKLNFFWNINSEYLKI